MLKNKIKELIGMLSKNIVTIMIVATVCVILSVGYVSLHSEPTYSVCGEVLVHNGSLSDVMSYGPTESNVSLVETCERIFNSNSMMRNFKDIFLEEKNFTVDELEQMIEVTAEGRHSLVLDFVVTCDDPDDALFIAESYVEAMIDYTSYVSASLTVTELNLDDEAVPNTPDVLKTAVLSLLGGAVAGSVLVLLFGKVKTRLNGAEDYKERYSAPLLGVVPDFNKNVKEIDDRDLR